MNISAASPPCGLWPSPLSAAAVTASGVIGLSEPSASGKYRYWIESRPSEGGRQVLVCVAPDLRAELPPPWSARNRVHEYGGGVYAAHENSAYFVDDNSQRIFRWDTISNAVTAIVELPVTDCDSDSETPAEERWADLHLCRQGQWLIAVRESHGPQGIVNELVALAIDGSGVQKLLFTGTDFVSDCRVSPDGLSMAWISWQHPNMSWDSSYLWTARLEEDMSVSDITSVAGGPLESVLKPRWSPAGLLHYASDRNGWWNLFINGQNGDAIVASSAEYASPQWVFGDDQFAFTDAGQLIANRIANGSETLVYLDPATHNETALTMPGFSIFGYLQGCSDGFVAVASGATRPSAIIEATVDRFGNIEHVRELANSVPPESLDQRYLSTPDAVSFPSTNGRMAHGLFYPPTNAKYRPARGELPPLLVNCHGGPTTRFRAVLDLRGVQYFTSRGFAVMQVNYGGSSGYGRQFRETLKGNWGVVDVQDCVAAANWLVKTEAVDPSAMAIRGSSAGGFTALLALMTSNIFAAGASYYGVTDASSLATDTHKFESHYCDGLIAKWPEQASVYAVRSPINHVSALKTPVIIFQGLRDHVVPPSQAERLVAALEASSTRHAYYSFEDEGHGFKQAGTQQKCLQAELAFYREIFELQKLTTKR